MRILVIDEDTEDMPQFCDGLKQLRHSVVQCSDWKQLETSLSEFKPEAIILDLMMPCSDLPSEECHAGFTTGAYLYGNVIHKLAPGVPFVVLSAAYQGTTPVRTAISRLKEFREFAGVFSKGAAEEDVLKALSPTSGTEVVR